MASTTKLAVKAITLAYEAKDWSALKANILLLSEKHGQLKVAIQTMVDTAMNWLDEIKDKEGLEKWLQLVETLRTVTEGKVNHFSVH